MYNVKPWIVVALALLLSACATVQTPSAAAPVSAEQRSVQLQHIHSWALRGSVSIQHNQRTDIASLQWEQRLSHYQFALFGPLGFGQVIIQGQPGSITLAQTDKPVLSAASPEQLMQRQLGWQIPVSNLYYWARGLLAPGAKAKAEYDSLHRLTQLQQQGWVITYSEYMRVDGVDMPKKMMLQTQNLTVKLAVKEWALPKS